MIPRTVRLSFLLTLLACAQVREPSGGPVDTTPPQLVEAQPPDGTTRFTGDRILLTFDERIKLERVGERLVVSPPLAEKPEVRVVGGRSVEVRLKAPLRAEATHVFNIGDAVVDLTEGNPAGGLVYVLSTGDHVDSLLIAGHVVDARTGEAAGGVAVLAYSPEDSTGFREGRPDQFTRTDGTGAFALRHLAPGRYMLHALRDQNGNLRYDLPNEEIAFLHGPVTATTEGDPSAPRPVLRLFREPARVQELLAADVLEQGAFRFVFALPAGAVELTDIARRGGRLDWTTWSCPTGDTVLAWPSDTTLLDEGRYALAVDGVLLDTLRYRRPGPMPWSLEMRVFDRPGGAGSFVLGSTRPIAQVDTARMGLLRPEGPVPFTLAVDTLDPRKIVLGPGLREGQRGTLELLPRALTGIYGDTNDTVRVPIGHLAREELGVFQVELKDSLPMGDGPWRLLFLDGQGRIVHSEGVDQAPGMVTWERVPPGTYRLRLLHDRNGNGRWDPGSLGTGSGPERVAAHPDAQQVRANWEVSLIWEMPITDGH